MNVKLILLVNIISIQIIYGNDESINCYVCRGCIDVTSEDIRECSPWVPDDPDVSTDITTERPETTTALQETTTHHQGTTTSEVLEPSTEIHTTTTELLQLTTETETFTGFDVIANLEETRERTSEKELQEMEEWIVNDGFIPVRSLKHKRSLDVKMPRNFRRNRNDESRPPRCATVYYQENGLLNVTRGCAYESDDHRRRCLEVLATDEDNILSCRLCEDDLCNSAINLSGATTVIFISSFAYYLSR